MHLLNNLKHKKMSTKKIAWIIAAVVIGIVGIAWMSMYFSYNNKEVTLRNEAVAQEGEIEAVYDEMWKVIKQKAQVTNEYKEGFHEIYKDIITGRYSNGENDGSLMKWIKESNPEFDASLYKDLMSSIEVLRTKFTSNQTRMLDIIREHKTLCETYPGKWFISNTTPIEYEVISSTKSKQVMETRMDDDVDIFNK